MRRQETGHLNILTSIHCWSGVPRSQFLHHLKRLFIIRVALAILKSALAFHAFRYGAATSSSTSSTSRYSNTPHFLLPPPQTQHGLGHPRIQKSSNPVSLCMRMMSSGSVTTHGACIQRGYEGQCYRKANPLCRYIPCFLLIVVNFLRAKYLQT